jgi:hypothetical protein
MAYKVLGQVTTTAASAATIVNLIEDSSFSGFPVTANISGTSNNVLTAINSATPWRFSIANTSSGAQLSSAGVLGITAPFGSAASAYGFTSGTSTWLTQGWAIGGSEPANTPANSSLDILTAAPVVGGTSYNYGYSYYARNATTLVTFRVSWYNASNSYISNNSFNSTSVTQNVWTRFTGTVTAPSTAVYAIFDWKPDSSIEWYLDGAVFGTSSSYATTFTEPLLPSVAATTSPFDKKINGFTTESVFSPSGVTPAGDFVTAYTVPAGKEAVVSTLVMTNLGSAATTYRVAVIPSGTSLTKNDLLFFDVPITGNSVQTITIGMTLAAGDVVRVAADNANVNATLFGSEN